MMDFQEVPSKSSCRWEDFPEQTHPNEHKNGSKVTGGVGMTWRKCQWKAGIFDEEESLQDTTEVSDS